MSKIKIVGIVAGLVLASLVGAVVGSLLSAGSRNTGGVYEQNEQNFQGGLTVGTLRQVTISRLGAIIATGTGSTTVGVKTTSTTQGVCFNLIATSSATAINMTFAASTTGQSTVGVIPVLKYGVCP